MGDDPEPRFVSDEEVQAFMDAKALEAREALEPIVDEETRAASREALGRALDEEGVLFEIEREFGEDGTG